MLILYRDLELLLESPGKPEDMERRIKRMDERSAAMQNMYSELPEKIAPIDQYL